MSKIMNFRNAPESTITLSVTAASSFTALAIVPGEDLLVQNCGSNLAYIRFGAESLTATAASLPILPNGAFITRRDELRDLYFAAICDSGNTTIMKVTPGSGS